MNQTLPPAMIHLYVTFPERITEQKYLTAYQCLLCSEEKQRLQRFHFAKHQHQFLITRALIRSTLSRYFEKKPQHWCFTKNSYGKPEIIRQADEPNLRFNISHTDGLIVCAVTLDDDVGVDVEYKKRNNALLDIANRYFSEQEIKQLQQTPKAQQKQRFFELWTLKEAYIKACGRGLSIPLNQFTFKLSKAEKITISFDSRLQDKAQHWQFWRLQPSDHHQAAIAVKSATHSTHQLQIKSVVPLED